MRNTICAALIHLLLVGAAVAGGPCPTVDWRNQRLSVESAGAPLSQILAEVARLTGLRVQGENSLRQSTDTHFVNLPLDEALNQLLANLNFALVERSCGGKKRCATLMIVGERSREITQEHDSKSAQSDAVESNGGADERLQQVYKAAEAGDLPVLQRAASANDVDATRAVAMDLLAQKDPATAADIALTAAASSDLGQRVMGLQALARVDSPSAIKALRGALTDPDEGIKQTALAALAQQSSVAALRLIRQAADDIDPVIGTMAEDLLRSDKR